MKRLLIVYHSQTGNTEQMARAVQQGACHEDIGPVAVRLLRCAQAGTGDLLWADAVLLGSPENFGYMSGGMKDFLDRTFYPCAGRLEGLPYAVFISAGNDGAGAQNAIARIVRGHPFKEIHAAVIIKGAVDTPALRQCEALGMAVSAGLELGVY